MKVTGSDSEVIVDVTAEAQEAAAVVTEAVVTAVAGTMTK